MARGRIRVAFFSGSTPGLINGGGPVVIHGYQFRETVGSSSGTVTLSTQPAASALGGQGQPLLTSGNATVEICGEQIAASGRSNPTGIPSEGIFLNGGVYVNFSGSGNLKGAVFYS